MKVLACVTSSVALALGLSAWAGTGPASAARDVQQVISTRALSSSRLLLHGRVRCTATVEPAVEVGHAVSVGLTLRNVSKHRATVSLGVFSAGIVLHAADGTTYDSAALDQFFVGIPPPTPFRLRAGATKRLWPTDVPVRWPGPVRITPECLGKPLPALQVTVTAPGPPPDDGTAIADVVAAAGHLLDRCVPQAPGVAVVGQIYPPSGDAPPMDAQCSISLTPEGGFSVAQVLVVTPPGLAGLQVYQPYETLWPNGPGVAPLASDPPYEAIAWEFVVTGNGATPVAASTQTASNSSTQMLGLWSWNGTGFEQYGAGSCGGTSYTWGGHRPGDRVHLGLLGLAGCGNRLQKRAGGADGRTCARCSGFLRWRRLASSSPARLLLAGRRCPSCCRSRSGRPSATTLRSCAGCWSANSRRRTRDSRRSRS